MTTSARTAATSSNVGRGNPFYSTTRQLTKSKSSSAWRTAMANVIEKELIQDQKDTVTSSSTSSSATDTTDAGGSNVPIWFPYIPTI